MNEQYHTGVASIPRRYNFFRVVYVCLIFLFSFLGYANAQRTMIDSLKKLLPNLRDTAQVDCLNTLSLAYSYLHTDSAQAYAQTAYVKALKNQYYRGQLMALNNQAHIPGYSLHEFPLQEKISLHSIELNKELRTLDSSCITPVLSETYMNLALALFCQ